MEPTTTVRLLDTVEVRVEEQADEPVNSDPQRPR